MTKEKEAAGRRGIRITDQFRKNEAMYYDFRCDDDRLTITIAPRATQDDAGEWRVQAWAGRASETNLPLIGWGETRADALRAVGDSWASRRLELRLPTFDWEAIAKALGTVRAL